MAEATEKATEKELELAEVGKDVETRLGDPDGAEMESDETQTRPRQKSILMSGQAPLYNTPQQIRSWGEPERHHAPPWGSAFFDLIYVAAAYRLGTLYGAHLHQEESAAKGLLYFLALFGQCKSAFFF